MIEKLIVENFGPINRIDIEIKKSLLLIGPSGKGKSTIAKLIAILRDFNFVYSGKEYFEFFKEYNIYGYLKPNTIINYVCPNYEVKFEKGNTTITYSEDYKNILENYKNSSYKAFLDNIIEFSEQIGKETSKILEEIKVYKDNEELPQKYEDLADKIKLNTEKLAKIIKINATPIYIPAERILLATISGSMMSILTNKIPLPNYLLSFGSEFEKAKKDVTEYYIDFLDTTYKYENNIDSIILEENCRILLSESASGIQTVLPMVLVLHYIDKRHKDLTNDMMKLLNHYTFVIEEPELNLFPKTQKDLIYFLVSSCTKHNNNLVITTHSPYVLSSLNNLLFATKTSKINEQETEKIIPSKYWLYPELFSALFVDNGTSYSILNENTLLIGENYIDEASEEVKYEFDQLMEIYLMNKNKLDKQDKK